MEGKEEIVTTQRLAWADLARGFCMMAILLFHTEKYYAGEEIIPYALYVDNVLITFFFISGYLFHNPQNAFSVPHKLLSILRGIIIPYFIFTAVIALPKAFVHDDTSLAETYADVLTGHASWFVAALAVAQVVFAFYVKISDRPMALAWMCALPYLIMAATYHLVDNEQWTSTNYWCWHNALLMLPFICAGYLFRRHSQWMTLIKRPWAIILMLISEVILKYWIYSHSLLMTLQPIHISSFTLLLIDGLIGCLHQMGGVDRSTLTGLLLHLWRNTAAGHTGAHHNRPTLRGQLSQYHHRFHLSVCHFLSVFFFYFEF